VLHQDLSRMDRLDQNSLSGSRRVRHLPHLHLSRRSRAATASSHACCAARADRRLDAPNDLIARSASRNATITLHVKSERHGVAVLHQAVLPFQSYFSSRLCFSHGPGLNMVIKGYNFGTDEGSLEVCMNHSGGLRGSIAFVDCPGTCFFWSGSQISL